MIESALAKWRAIAFRVADAVVVADGTGEHMDSLTAIGDALLDAERALFADSAVRHGHQLP